MALTAKSVWRAGLLALFSALLAFRPAAGDTPGGRVGDAQRPLVIAHRGASGYLPEHTIAAKAMAYAQGADYIEQDLVMTGDDQLIVLHDHHLDTVSNVRERFPDRKRDDGRYYVVDFTLAEIRQLAVSERFALSEGQAVAVFEGRFPLGRSTFRIHTFAEEIELIQGLNRSMGRSVGIYPEIKSPAFHHEEGKDIAAATLDVLARYGYRHREDKVFLQCFDPYELQRVKTELLRDRGMGIRLVQLISTDERYQPLLSAEGMQQVAGWADGIGPSLQLLVDAGSTPGAVRSTGLVEHAHAAGLLVHPWTFRREASELPSFARDFEELHRVFFETLGIDGVFTDFPDVTTRYLELRQ